ncbi:hypothetical protein F0169_03700 [Pseudomonas sp. MAFF 212408]|uniref:Uncharacterized protein n=1 Tax=Pseudomonas kitaguniensis TaxID=2607908 RepID=A0A5N7KHR2_9PSED|nr:hypothetical protein [Pseudomonas kitaguniensis]
MDQHKQSPVVSRLTVARGLAPDGLRSSPKIPGALRTPTRASPLATRASRASGYCAGWERLYT